jgi:ubiquinone/menaquinone biosynthesis C-methylase UbiE
MMADKSKFDTETTARHYAAARPSYPSELFDTLDELLGRRLAGADVVDVAAGTGISSRQLAERGAHVTAVELSAAMIAQLAASSSGVRVVQGSGHALPLADDSADLITYAQAWHWMDPALAIPEIRRVLRPRGVLGIWWNQTIRTSGWAREQSDRITAVVPDWDQGDSTTSARVAKLNKLLPKKQSFRFEWERTVPIETQLSNLASKSYIAELGERLEPFIDTERRILTELFPEGEVTEHFSTVLVATLPNGEELSIAQKS